MPSFLTHDSISRKSMIKVDNEALTIETESFIVMYDMYVCMYVYVMYVCMYVCMYMYVCICMYELREFYRHVTGAMTCEHSLLVAH